MVLTSEESSCKLLHEGQSKDEHISSENFFEGYVNDYIFFIREEAGEKHRKREHAEFSESRIEGR